MLAANYLRRLARPCSVCGEPVWQAFEHSDLGCSYPFHAVQAPSITG